MKRKEAEPFLAVLADYATPLSALGALVSLTDTAKHLGFRSANHALRSVKEQESQQISRIPDGVHESRRPIPAEGSGVRGGRLRASLSRARARGALLALAALAAAAPALAQTEQTVPQDWSLKPDAVAAGGKFRLLFVSSTTRDATSTDIADYNTHVQTAAAAGHADIQAYSAGFTAIGSTSAVNARANTLTRSTDTDAPIYWVDATATRTAIATAYADFYDGAWGNRSARTESGVVIGFSTSPDAAFTGTATDGTTRSSYPLGTGNFLPVVGAWRHPSSGLTEAIAPETESRSFLGLSPVFVVSAAAPVTTLVSNTGEDLRTNSTASYQAQAFTAGADATISEILIRLGVAEGKQTSVKLREDDGGEPGDLVATFVNPGTFADGALHAFTAPSGTTVTVEAGETYWVSVNEGISSNGDRAFYSRTSEHGETGEPDWEIGDTRLRRKAETANWSSSNAVLSMAVKGTVGTVTASSDGSLSGLTLSEGTLDPAFASEHYEYAASVALATARITVTPTTSDSAAAVAYQDAVGAALDDADGDPLNGHQVDLAAGANTVNVVVTAEDGITTVTYALTVWRPACAVPLGGRTEIWASEIAVGAVLNASLNTVGYGFQSSAPVGGLSDGDFGFGGTDHSVATLWVETNGTLQLGISSSLPEDDFPALRLHACGDPFGLTDADDYSLSTHFWDSSGLDWSSETGVSVALSASPDATLSGLSLSAGTLSPTFASDVEVYTATVPNATARITVTPTTSEAGAKVDYRDGSDAALADADTVTEGQQVDLGVGANTVKLLVTSGDRENTKTYRVTVTREAASINNAPVFTDGTTTSRDVAENTVAGQPVGAPVAATDDDTGDTLTYSLEGTDEASFGIVSTSGQILTSAALNHEAKSTYSVTVKVVDDGGAADTIGVTVNVTDLAEQPEQPAAPTVTATAGTSNSLDVSWTAPGLNGGPEITGYELQHRTDSEPWTETTLSGTGTTASIEGLDEDTAYEVQVRALNGEMPSDWSPSGTGSTSANNAPVFVDGASTSRDVAENTVAGQPVGAPVTATDADTGDTLSYSKTGADAAEFGLNDETGQLLTATVLDYEDPVDADDDGVYEVTLSVSDSNGGTDSIDVTVTVTDVVESSTVTVTGLSDASTDENKPWTSPAPAASGAIGEVTWSKSGADAARFTLAADGKVTLPAQNYESAADADTSNDYEVTVEATDSDGNAGDQSITVTVTDLAEQPEQPAAPTVTATAGTSNSLDVSWTAPGLNGGPEITGYELQYRLYEQGAWTETGTLTGTTETIDNLAEDTRYEVQVRALNGETPSDWSLSGTATTGRANSPPEFDDGATTTRAVAENTASGANVGAAVAATDADTGDTLTYSLEGTDEASFGIVSTTGQILTSAALNHEAKSTYSVTVKVVDDKGAADTIGVTVNVTDLDEQPGQPAAPTVTATAGTSNSLDVSWTAPGLNGGPEITGYELQYRLYEQGAWTETGTLTGTSETIDNLAEDTRYEVQVRALNGETDSDWSLSGYGTPGDAASLPVLTIYAVGQSGELAEFEVRRSGATSGRLTYWREEDIDGDLWFSSWQNFPVGRASLPVYVLAARSGTVEVRLMPPITPFCGEPGATSACTDNYVVGNPGSATMAVTASSSIAPRDSFVSGARLTLRYARALDATSTPGPKDWVVRAASGTGARALAVTAVAVEGVDAVLSLSPPAAPGEAVTLDYLPWAMHPLLDGDGVEAAPLTDLAVRNETLHGVAPGFAPAGVEAPSDNADGLRGTGVPRLPPGGWLSALLAEKPASAVTRLDLRDRNLTDISALAGLADLEMLDLADNAVADAWPLAGLVNLKRLDLSGNRIGDVSALAGLAGLEALDLSGNAVADAWPLSGLVNLKRLDLSGNPLGDVTALAGLAGLEVLVLDGGGVAEVLPLALLPRLARLDLSGNALADVTLLAELRSLARLDLSGNRIAAVDALGDLSHLLWLDLTGNPVADAAPLGRLTALRWLWLDADSASDERSGCADGHSERTVDADQHTRTDQDACRSTHKAGLSGGLGRKKAHLP